MNEIVIWNCNGVLFVSIENCDSLGSFGWCSHCAVCYRCKYVINCCTCGSTALAWVEKTGVEFVTHLKCYYTLQLCNTPMHGQRESLRTQIGPTESGMLKLIFRAGKKICVFIKRMVCDRERHLVPNTLRLFIRKLSVRVYLYVRTGNT